MTEQEDIANKIDIAREVGLFQDLDPSELEAVARIMTPVRFGAREAIMKEGEPGHSMYVVAEGEVQVNKALTMKFGEDDFRETEKTLTVLRGADNPVIGEMALVTDTARSATVTAMTDCTLYRITREEFLYLGNSNPALGFKVTLRLAALVSQRLKTSGDDVIRLTTALSIALSQ